MKETAPSEANQLGSRAGVGTGGLPTPGRFSVSGRWNVVHEVGPAGPFHERDWASASSPTAWFLSVTRPALVLGSTQDDGVVDRKRASASGVDVVRRRSGGGAVLVEPGRLVWVDLFVPAGDPLWQVDVGRAFHWVGRLWTEGLATLGVEARWHDGPLVETPWSKLVCFAGLGPGEVMAAGRKVVGISQRRTPAGALFQCAALLAWDPTPLVDLLALSVGERRQALGDLDDVATGLDVSPSEAFAAALAGA